MDFDALSEEAQETARGMIQFCIEKGYRMGMDEGCDADGRPYGDRLELEDYVSTNKP